MLLFASVAKSRRIEAISGHQWINSSRELTDSRAGMVLGSVWSPTQWKQPYPGAIMTLEKLAASGAKMVVISNSLRRASTTLEKLSSLGFDPSLFVGAITSGELTHQHLLMFIKLLHSS